MQLEEKLASTLNNSGEHLEKCPHCNKDTVFILCANKQGEILIRCVRCKNGFPLNVLLMCQKEMIKDAESSKQA